MEINLLTPDDLETFKKQLLEEMRKSFQHFNTPPMPKLLKAKEVRNMLHISAGTLTAMRKEGDLSYIELSETHFLYPYDEIMRLLQKKLVKAKAFVIAVLYISQAVADMAAAYTDCCGFA